MFSRVIINTLIIIGIALLIGWGYENFYKEPAPCTEPIAYSLGFFDSRFGISQKDFLAALSEAETIWETPISKELFVYYPEEGKIKINLIYDYRQETTEALSSIENVVKEGEDTYENLQAKYSSIKREYESIKSNYDLEVQEFNEKNARYEEKIEAWN